MNRHATILAAASAVFLGAFSPGSLSASDTVTGGDLTMAAKLFPLTAGFRLDDNVYRSTGSDRRTDGITYFSGGILLTSTLKETWRGEAHYRCFADLYSHHGDLNNYRNHFLLSLASTPRPLQGWLRKNYLIRRSPETNYDYWDDRSEMGLAWNPSTPWNVGIQFENSLRRYFNDELVIQARNFNDNTVALSVMRSIEEHLSVQAGGAFGRREFNRYAVGKDGGGFRVLGEVQMDDTFGGQAGLRWYAASVLNDLVFQVQSTRSNNYGSSSRVRSLSWAAGMNPMPRLTLQMMFRLYHKRYDVDPLTIPEFQLGFNDEDGQDLLSAKATWDWDRSWNASLAFSRLRTESAIPARYYIKQVFSPQIQRSF